MPSPAKGELLKSADRLSELPRAKTECADCETLKAQVLELRRNRDQALLELAQERERSEALRLNFPTDSHYVGTYQAAERIDVPLRYLVVDRVNEMVKSRFRFLHSGAKSSTALVTRLSARFRSNRDP